MANKVVIALIVDLDKMPQEWLDGEAESSKLTAAEIREALIEDMEEDEKVAMEIRVWKKAVPHILTLLPRSEG